MQQIVIFRNPNITSDITVNLNAEKARGGIRCKLLTLPEEPSSNAILNNGQWCEVAASDNSIGNGSPFAILLDGSDSASSKLASILRNKKTIDEMVVFELNTTSNKEQYGYYFSKVFVHSGNSLEYGPKKLLILNCLCISFKQKDRLNDEPVIWDWNTQEHRYTGTIR